MTVYHMRSSDWIFTPGVLRWAIESYRSEDNRKYLRAVLHKGWNLPQKVAHALLSEAVSYVVNDEDGSVSFQMQEEAS